MSDFNFLDMVQKSVATASTADERQTAYQNLRKALRGYCETHNHSLASYSALADNLEQTIARVEAERALAGTPTRAGGSSPATPAATSDKPNNGPIENFLHGISAKYGIIVACIPFANDFIKPLFNVSTIELVLSAAICGSLFAFSFLSKHKRELRIVASYAAVVLVVSGALRGAEIFVPGANANGVTAQIVPGASALQDALLGSLSRVESKLKDTAEGIDRLEKTTRELKKETSEDPDKELFNRGITNKPAGLKDAFRDGNGQTVSLLIKSGYWPSRPELREALLQMRPSPQLDAAIAPLLPEIKALACNFVEYGRARPMMAHAVVGAENPSRIMTAMGKDKWRALCLDQKQKWRAALAAFDSERAYYNLSEAEKQKNVDACLKRHNTKSAMEKWQTINCDKCGPLPSVPANLDKDEALFMGFTRDDAFVHVTTYDRYSPFGSVGQKGPKNPAEAFCAFQFRVRTEKLPFDAQNHGRVKELATILD